MISSSLKDALQQKYQRETVIYSVFYGKPLEVTQVPNDLFIVIEPNRSHETEGVLYLVGESDYPSAARVGNHYLRIKAKTWIDEPTLALTLKSKWASFGDLWAKPVISEPMQFIVKKGENLVKCS
jgi:hypothetical protein